jgi:hypothetical protein
VLEQSRDTLPLWLSFVTDVNIAGLLSFVLAAAGMVVGSLLTQRACPPKRINPTEAV